ncbi:hypothetical protein D049_4451B, partial [Vibrio parahaemolyticus VPTS-2010]
LKVTALIGG